jgi:hypothetical protein
MHSRPHNDEGNEKMSSNNDWLQLCDDIDDGEWDAGLEGIAQAVASRRDIVARRNARRLMRSLAVDDRVKLTNGIKPRYLEGMVGVVLEIREGAAVIKLDKMPSHTGAGRPPSEGYKQKLLVPLINLVKVDGDAPSPMELDESSKIGDDSEFDEDDAEELDDD